jgi:flotillin
MLENLANLGSILFIGGAIILSIIILAIGYVKAPPDKAIIISGLRKKPKVLIGKAGIKIPFLERSDVLSLKQVTIDVKTGEYIPTLDFINIQVDAVVKVRVSTEPEKMELAMKNFLNKGSDDIVYDLQDSLQGNMREIIGTLSLKDICNNRDEFGNQVQKKAIVDMEKLGIEIISCNIQNVADKNGLIEDMGMDNTSKIKKDASIAKAEADRDVAIAQARADKEANDARVISETEIAERNNELAIKRAELKKDSDIKQAEADSAYKIQEQEQRKTIVVAESDADIAKQERQIILKTKEAEVKEQELSATIKKKADADRYDSEQKAEVELFERKKKAEADRYEKEQEAEALKKKADADRYEQEQKAAGIKAVGEAEAAAIKAKALAEAEGIEKKAEAMTKMDKAAILEMFFESYPKVMEAAAKPLQNVDQIMMFGDGNSAKMVSDIVSSTKQVIEGIKGATGVDPMALIAGFFGGKLGIAASDKSDDSDSSKKIDILKENTGIDQHDSDEQ